MTDTADSRDHESVESVFEETVTVTDEPFNDLHSVRGFTEPKDRLRQQVVEQVEYDQYGTTSVFLFGKSDQSPVGRLTRTLTGKFGEEYTFFAVS